MTNPGNKLLREALRELRRRLPAGWRADLIAAPSRGPIRVDGCLRVRAPDRKVGSLLVEAKRRLEPRGVLALVARRDALSGAAPLLVVAPYLSPAVRERLREANLAFLDLTGNVRIALRRPGLFIATQGADVDPDRKARPSRSLRGAKAGRVVRALVDAKEPPGVRELAERAGVDPGYASRVLSLLDRAALIERRGRGRIVQVDWARMLRRWSEDAPLESRGPQTACLEPRGLATLTPRLRDLDMRYAITGTLAAARLAPVAAPRLAVVYVEDMKRAIEELGLRPTDAGANVLLIEPRDDGVFAGAVTKDGLVFVAPSQAAADLLSSPGRGPAEAEELIEWMSANEEIWRG